MTPPEPERQPYTLQTVDRAVSLLEFVATNIEPPTVKTVATALDLNLTTSYHLVRTLVARGYLERGNDGRLRLGSAVGTLFHAYRSNLDVHEDLARLTHRIKQDTNETAFLSTLDGRSVILKELVEGSQPLRVGGLTVGYAGNELRRASGKAVLAFVADSLRDEIVARNLQSMPNDERDRVVRTLPDELQTTRKRGWAIDDQDSEIGITGLAAPVFDSAGDIYGAIGLVAPTVRFTPEKDRLVDVVLTTGRQATEVLQNAAHR